MAGLQPPPPPPPPQSDASSQAAAMESADAVSAAAASSCNKLEEPDHSSSNWYFPREFIDKSSPSRLDGIDLKKETYFRKSYCTFLQDLGMRLKVPQVTIATAIVFCHRFFLRQSHLKNDRYLIATTCMFLAGKVEETPQKLRDVISLSYEIRNKKDPTAAQRIKQQDVFEEQKEIVLLGERMVLATLGFDLNVHHPYKPLVAAIKKFKVAQNALAQVAWNFVNDGLRTSLCLQFKPHHIAAGAIFLAAKFLKVKLPSEGEKVWWQEFDVTPRQLEEVSNQMLELYEQNREVPSSRTSEPSASIGTISRRRPTTDMPSTSGVEASEKTGDVKSRENMNSHKRSASEAFPASACTISDKVKEDNEEYTVEVKPRTTENNKSDASIRVDKTKKPDETSNNGTSENDMPHPAMEETDTNIVAKGETRTSCSAAPEEEISTARIGENRATEDSAIASETNVAATVEESGPKQDVSKQDSEANRKTDWGDLGDVNIDRVKAAIQRRKQGGEVRASIPKRELTDEEELLEMDLENGHEDKQHDGVTEEFSELEDTWKGEDQSDANNKKEGECNSERYLDNDEGEIYVSEHNRQSKPEHHQKSDTHDGDDGFRHDDTERDHKKPRVKYRS